MVRNHSEGDELIEDGLLFRFTVTVLEKTTCVCKFMHSFIDDFISRAVQSEIVQFEEVALMGYQSLNCHERRM